MALDTTRHNDLITSIIDELNTPVHLIGCGSIGTLLGTTLVRLGFTNLHLWDEDMVEAHNLANQYFDHSDLGELKTRALARKLLSIDPGVLITRHDERFDEQSAVKPGCILIACVDSMAARKDIYTVAQEQQCLLLDGRMGAHNGQLHLVRTTDRDACAAYARTLYNDSDASAAPCTMRTILYTINVLTGLMARRLIQALKDPKRTGISEYLNLDEPGFFNTGWTTLE